MTATSPPSADAQLAFLAKLQRLFAEGDFTATYKFALLIALADLAVELGRDDGSELVLLTRQLGERFLDLYWRHVTPYGQGRVGSEPGVLVQNNGPQAAVISAIGEFRARVSATSPQVAARHSSYPALLSKVTHTVSALPLTHLQNFGGATDEFLYNRPAPGRVRLKPGVMYCLRRFQPLIQQLARAHWLAHVKGNRRNHSMLGEADDLEEFLFSTSRQSLSTMAEGLRRLDGAHCFYCRGSLTSANVDHFIPFSQYPRDLAHNFVLAHPSCNRSKSDTLAGKQHLERWLARLSFRADDIAELGAQAGLVGDAAVCRRVASWGYSSALAAGGAAWLAPDSFEAIDDSYIECLESHSKATVG
ncbi:HNH endonuclease [uncultured Piscinibacter sp.]|uniref:HNH endonuclease n=1 Tax=uncultured Piscinibacter sp. TaxID=1131835 RepID=UPI00261C16DE|nr:HNH endonuclease [uncultured Piscinibacter sp.]